MAGSFLLGTSLFHAGQFAASLEQVARAVGAPGGHYDPAVALFAGPDLGVFCRAYLSHLHALQGDGAQADANCEQSLRLARDVSHPFSLAIALDYAAMLSVFREDAELARARAEESSAICRKYGFVYYFAWAEMLAGWAMGASGDAPAGLARLRAGLDAFRATGAELRLPFYYGLLAEVSGFDGRPGDALASVSSGFAFQSKNGECWWAAELHRIQGDLLSKQGDHGAAQASYNRAVEAAGQMGARLFEIRAAARLGDTGHRAERRAGSV
jgi:predicted ATPase